MSVALRYGKGRGRRVSADLGGLAKAEPNVFPLCFAVLLLPASQALAVALQCICVRFARRVSCSCCASRLQCPCWAKSCVAVLLPCELRHVRTVLVQCYHLVLQFCCGAVDVMLPRGRPMRLQCTQHYFIHVLVVSLPCLCRVLPVSLRVFAACLPCHVFSVSLLCPCRVTKSLS